MKTRSTNPRIRWILFEPIYRLPAVLVVFTICLLSRPARAQSPATGESVGYSVAATPMASVSMPEAPMPQTPALAAVSGYRSGADSDPAQAAASGNAIPRRTRHTGYFDTLIDPQEIAPRLTASDKVGMGLKASVSPFAVIGWVGSATYSEAFNRSPNYGQSGKDYLQRLGAAAARSSSEGIFSTSIMAPILHEDPRYFVEGPGHPGFNRAVYAVSRVFVTKTDDGRSTANWALLSGNAIGAGLTQTYYPAGNRNFRETATTFGVSLGGSGVKFLFEEFFYKEASIAQLKRKLESR